VIAAPMLPVVSKARRMSAFGGSLSKCSVAGKSLEVPSARRAERLHGWSESPEVVPGLLASPLSTLTPLPSVVEAPLVS